MAKPARVLHQVGGTGVVVFAGQTLPAAAIRADTLKELQRLSQVAIEKVKSGESTSVEFRESLQSLHLSLSDLALRLQETARLHECPLPRGLQVDSRDFVYLAD